MADVVYILAALLEPVVPRLSEKLFTQLAAQPLTFQALAAESAALLDRAATIGKPAPLIARIEEAQIEALIQPESTAPAAAPATEAKPKAKAEPAAKAAQAARADRCRTWSTPTSPRWSSRSARC